MFSIPRALLWEFFSRGRVPLLAFFLLGNSMPLLIYSALSQFNVEQNDPAFLTMHVLFLPWLIFIFAIGVLMAQGSLSRLYAAPISTRAIVAWHMFPGGLVLAAEVAVSLKLQDLLFGFQYSVLGPALFAIAIWSASQMLVCVAYRTFLGASLGIAPVVALFFWLMARFGTWFGSPTHPWAQVTMIEVLTLLVVTVVAFYVTVSGFARDRCGERIASLGLWTWLVRLWEDRERKNTKSLPPFASPMAAQLWYEWRLKGFALPLVVVILLGFATCVVAIRIIALGNWQYELYEIHGGLIAAGGLFGILAGVVGLLIGTTANVQSTRKQEVTLRDITDGGQTDQMGSFLASRPFSDASFAKVILQVIFKSLLIGWTIWAVALCDVFLLRFFSDDAMTSVMPANAGYWYFPLTLLGAWIAMTNFAAIGLSGRSGRAIIIAMVGFFLMMFASWLLEHYTSRTLIGWIQSGVLFGVCGAIVLGTGRAYWMAKGHKHIRGSAFPLAVGAWLTILVAGALLSPKDLPATIYPLVAALAALAVLPFALTPLVIAWNRHR